MIFRECENCGATLDPGERCTCEFQKAARPYIDRKKEAEEKAKQISDRAIAVFMFGGKLSKRK